MKTVDKLLRKKNFGFNIIIGGLLAVLGFFVAYFSNQDYFDFVTAKDYVFDCPSDMLNEEAYYDVSNELLYDWYAEDDEGRYYITVSQDITGGNKYLGYFVYTKNCEQADKVVESTWNYVENDVPATEMLKGKGYVYSMSSDEIGYFDEMCEAYGITEDLRQYSTIVLVPGNIAAKSISYGAMIVGIALIVFGIALIISFLLGGYKKNVKKCMQNYSISEDALENDVVNSEEVNGVNIGRQYILSGGKHFVFPLANLVWSYKKTTNTRHMLYGVIPTGTTKSYSVIFVTSDGKVYEQSEKNEAKCDELISAVSKRAPYALYGYTEELQQAVNSNFAQVVNTVEERKFTATIQ